jgi:DNA-binding NarL/FixJ family response regulator
MPDPLFLPDLTPRQIDVVERLARGLTDKRIAAELGIKHSTVRIYVASVAFRLGLHEGQTNTRVMIARWWLAQHPETLAA